MEQRIPLPHLSPHVLAHIAETLAETLPPPADDTPQNRRLRDQAAMAVVAGLRPANAAEALDAVHYVVTSAHGAESIEAAGRLRDQMLAIKLRRQGIMLMREALNQLAMLNKVQAGRLAEAAVWGHLAAPEPAWPETAAAAEVREAQPPARRFRLIRGGRSG